MKFSKYILNHKIKYCAILFLILIQVLSYGQQTKSKYFTNRFGEEEVDVEGGDVKLPIAGMKRINFFYKPCYYLSGSFCKIDRLKVNNGETIVNSFYCDHILLHDQVYITHSNSTEISYSIFKSRTTIAGSKMIIYNSAFADNSNFHSSGKCLVLNLFSCAFEKNVNITGDCENLILNYTHFFGNKLDLTYASADTIYLYYTILPDSIDISNSPLKSELNFLRCSFKDSTRIIPGSNNYQPERRHLINLFGTDISKISMDYQHFGLWFDKTKSLYEKEKVYLDLLANFKSKNQNYDYQLCDIEFHELVLAKKNPLWHCLQIWNNYGYSNIRIFYWTFIGLILLSAICYIRLDSLNDANHGAYPIALVINFPRTNPMVNG